jgi:hypothetical protein
VDPLNPFSICATSTFQIVEGEVGGAWRVMRMYVKFWNYEFDRADGSQPNGRWEFCEAFEEMFDPLANDVV